MPYTPINMQIYLAAFVGASAGQGISGRWLVDQVPTDPVNANIASVAGAFAQEFDIEFAASGLPVDCYSYSAVQEYSLAAWLQRNPNPLPATPTNLTPATYIPICKSIIAIIQACETYLAAQTISPPDCCCTGDS